MEKEYTVIVNNREDLQAVEADLTASTGEGPIPSRTVDIANPRPGSRIQTHFMLTDQEAEALRADSRIRAVEIPPEQRDDIQIGKRATQTSKFIREDNLFSDRVNWGLRRCVDKTNTFQNQTSVSDIYEYSLTGKGVDVVIQDSGIEADHPEWEDADGNSRLQQIDWYTASGLPGSQDATFYTDYDGHGTHCAGIAAAKTYGWAKDANIYAQKLGGLEGPTDPDNGISISDSFDTIRLWHNNKNGSRPTVVNMSWGYSTTVNGNPSSGNYRGTSWTWGSDYTSDSALWAATGVVNPYQNGDREIPARIASIDAEIDDMIADGIHVVIAAGNDYYKGDVLGGPDYNNTVSWGGSTLFYHRGSSPHSDDAFIVGNITTTTFNDSGDYKDRTSGSSSRGPRVNMWAPGDGIISTVSTTSIYITDDYPPNDTYKVASIGGTSMAAPQVAGVIAQHLEAFPDATPAEMINRIIADSTAVIYETGSSTDYDQFNTTILGSPNRMLWSRYGRQPGQLTNSTAVLAPPQPTYMLSTGSTTVNEGATVRVTLDTTFVTNGTDIDYTITGISSSDLSAGALTGTFTIQNNTAFIEFTLEEDTNTEGTETITFALDNGQDSLTITVNDTSTAPPPQQYTISVSANGSSAYTLSGTDRNGSVNGDNATVRINQGDQITFQVSATGHPFWLKTFQSTGTDDAIPGVTNNGAEEANVVYTFNSTGTFYYICQVHGSMTGEIIVS